MSTSTFSLCAVLAVFVLVTPLAAAMNSDPELTQWLAFWESHAPTCEVPPGSTAHPSKFACDDGDMTLFNGLLCASGDERGCKAVAAAQRPDGSWHRSPRLAEDRAARQSDSFSPDMGYGVMLWIIAKRDNPAARAQFASWLHWLEVNQFCKSETNQLGEPERQCSLRVCLDASEQGCYPGPGWIASLASVVHALGLDTEIMDPDLRALFDKLRNEALNWLALDAQLNAPGFSRHLAAAALWIHMQLNTSDPAGVLPRVGARFTQKEPRNPFFAYLAGSPPEATRSLTLSLCPKDESQLKRKNQWAWERTDSEEAWRDAMLWDCIFMARLLGIPVAGH